MIRQKETSHVPASRYQYYIHQTCDYHFFAGSSPYAIIILVYTPRRRIGCEHGAPGVFFERNT